jgi:Uma2 family endonuclease
MTTAQKLVTAEQLLLMSHNGQGKRYELVRGVLIERVATGDPHAVTVSRIDYALTHYAEVNDYGETRTGEPGYRLEFDPDTVRAPDVAWIAPGRIPEGTEGYPNLAPDLVIEVLSPRQDLAEKAAMWLSFGSREVWLANPEQTTVTRYRPDQDPEVLGEDDVLDGGDLLPGFSIPVWQLFRRHR